MEQPLPSQRMVKEPPLDDDLEVPFKPNSSWPPQVTFNLVERNGWGARPPKDASPMHMPIMQVQYTYEDLSKYGEDIPTALKKFQDYCMDEKKLLDIPYNFIIGNERTVYEGRGWSAAPASVAKGNTVDIAFIGNYEGEINPPPFMMLEVASSLVKQGIREMMIHPHYNTIPILKNRSRTPWQMEYF